VCTLRLKTASTLVELQKIIRKDVKSRFPLAGPLNASYNFESAASFQVLRFDFTPFFSFGNQKQTAGTQNMNPGFLTALFRNFGFE